MLKKYSADHTNEDRNSLEANVTTYITVDSVDRSEEAEKYSLLECLSQAYFPVYFLALQMRM